MSGRLQQASISCVILIALSCCGCWAQAQNLGIEGNTIWSGGGGRRGGPAPQPKNPDLRARYQEGSKAYFDGKTEVAAQALRDVIDKEPDFQQAHELYVQTAKRAATDYAAKSGKPQADSVDFNSPAIKPFIAAYQNWAKQNPTKGVFLWGLARLAPYDSEEALKYVQDAAKAEPGFAPAWLMMEGIAEQRGDLELKRACYKKLSELVPDEPRFALQYAATYRFQEVRLQSGRSISPFRAYAEEVIKKYPKDPIVIRTLAMVAGEAPSVEQRTEVLERVHGLREQFADDGQLQVLMGDLFKIYSDSNAVKATALAEEMQKAYPNIKNWQKILDFQKGLNSAREQISNKRFTDAIQTLKTVRATADELKMRTATPGLMLAEAHDGAGDVATGYAELAKITASDPRPQYMSALLAYAAKLKKSPDTVKKDVWTIRTANAKVFKDFELVDFRTGKKVKLSDYRGRTVFITFWFPHCGFCKEEYPYFQRILDKYKDKGFVVLAPNIVSEEDSLATQNMRAYSFTLLKMPYPQWSKEQYGISTAPVNFLLDGEGRIIYEPRVWDRETQQMMEWQVESLIQQNNDEMGERAFKPAPGVVPARVAKYTKTSTGLEYADLKVGTGSAVKLGHRVVLHYTGWLSDGTKFSSSKDSDKPFSFVVGEKVIKGWSEGVQGMNAGGIRQLRIPPELAYGDKGFGNLIPPGSTLIFELELQEVKEDKQTEAKAAGAAEGM